MNIDTNDNRDGRRENRLELLGTREPRCQCGETDPAALSVVNTIVCYECQARSANKATVEKHHASGRHNSSITVPVPGNDHRILSDCQQDWPANTLRNPDGSPLLKASAALRGFIDMLKLFIERVIGWVSPFLEQLDAQLTTIIGERWWQTVELSGVPL